MFGVRVQSMKSENCPISIEIHPQALGQPLILCVNLVLSSSRISPVLHIYFNLVFPCCCFSHSLNRREKPLSFPLARSESIIENLRIWSILSHGFLEMGWEEVWSCHSGCSQLQKLMFLQVSHCTVPFCLVSYLWSFLLWLLLKSVLLSILPSKQ